MRKVERNGIILLEFENLGRESSLVHGVTTRYRSDGAEFNVSVNLRKEGAVLRNRVALCESLSLRLEDWIAAEQIHGDRVAVVGSAERGRGSRYRKDAVGGADGLISAEAGLVLATFAADCPLVVLYESEKQIIGSIHSGWRSTVAGIVPKAVTEIERLGGSAARLRVGVGPCICRRCFEVREDFVERLRDSWPRGLAFLDGNRKLFRFDLREALRTQLLDSGVRAENIEFAEFCTFETDWLFSYRRDGPNAGGFAAFICRKQ